MRHTYGVEIFGFIAEKLSSLSGFVAMAKELVQNADDERSEYVEFDFRDDGLRIENASVFDDEDFQRIINIASRGKETEPHKTGAFGIGFVSVYQICDHPVLESDGRRYLFLPEEQAVDEDDLGSPIRDHTEFFLPWALNPNSEVRMGLKAPAVSKNDIADYAGQLASAAPDILLFLRTLRVLRILRNGSMPVEFERDDSHEPRRRVIKKRKGRPSIVREWIVYEKGFSALEAADLNKEPIVGVAFPIVPGSTEDDGVLYNFLPTGLYTEYRFHINGDFFPTPDRKNILTEGDKRKVEWNTKVVRVVAESLITCVMDLRDRVRPEVLYRFLPARDFHNRNLPMLDTISQVFYENAENREIVPDDLSKWYKPDQIYLLPTKDSEVRHALKDIGIPIVNTALRSSWTVLQGGLGTQSLGVEALVDYVQELDIEEGTVQSSAPQPFDTIQGLSNILLFLQDRLTTPGEDKMLPQFGELAICPDRNHTLRPFARLKLMTLAIQKIFLSTAGMPFVEASLQQRRKEILLRLTSEYGWRDVVDFFSGKTPQEIGQMDGDNAIDLMELHNYLADNEPAILRDPQYCEKLKQSSVFMTNKQFKPLSGLCLSGNYKDPIGLDVIIDESILSDKSRGFLKKLGVKPLDFPTYVTKYAPEYYRDQSLWGTADKRLELTNEIRKNFSWIADNRGIRNLLKTLNMIPCNDNEFHAPQDIYLRSDLLDVVLADDYLYPDQDSIGANLAEWNEWLKALDVMDRPRPQDVVRRIRELAAHWSPENAQALEHLFYYLCDVFSQDDFCEDKAYDDLKDIAWLPAEGDEESYHLPSDVYLPFSQHLFYSQAKFVRFTQRRRMRGRFLDYIEIGNYPSSAQIVGHLQWLAGQDKAPHFEIYRVLNDQCDKIPKETLDPLFESRCVYMEGRGYYRAAECYWGAHPFGPYRQRADDQLRNYYNILRRIGVKEEAVVADYIAVMLEISDEFSKGNHPLDEDAKSIVRAIYSFAAQHSSEISDVQLSDLSQRKVVLGRSGLLRVPSQMFFEDKGIAADVFRGRLKHELIDKESDTWQLLERLGVRHLSKAIHPVEFRPSSDGGLSRDDTELVRSRKLAIVTIVETQRKDFSDGWDLALLDSIEVYEAAELSVKYEVRMNGQSIDTGHQLQLSFYDRDVNRLYISQCCDRDERTYEIARNLAAIINPQIDPCHMLPVLVEVLSPSHGPDMIGTYLRRMGYDIVTVPTVNIDANDERGQSSEASSSEDRTDADGPQSSDEETPRSDTPVSDESDTTGSGSEHKKAKTKRRMHGSGEEPADEITRKRRAWLEERLEHERAEHTGWDSAYDPVSHGMTPDEKARHRRFSLIFYNRQVQELLSRVQELKAGEGPAQCSIYGPEWEEVSRVVRERDGGKCRRCGLSEEDGVGLAVHHICPRKEGGSNWHSNLITLCRTCHAEVEDRPWLL